MRHVAVVAVTSMLVLVVNASAQLELLSARQPDKIETAAVPNIPNPERQGGDTVATAVVIPALPYSTTGTTTGYNNDYDEACPYSGSTAPDVVYAFTPATDARVDVDLCGSSYDTKVYIYDAALNVIDCNDDFYFAAPCGVYVSKLENVLLAGGLTYFIVIDGYGTHHGEYVLDVDLFDPTPPCWVIPYCNAIRENEPPLVYGYVDMHNGGCNSVEYGTPFSEFYNIDPYHELDEFAGTLGWYQGPGGVNYRDTDWLRIYWYFETLPIEIETEQPINVFWIAPSACGDLDILEIFQLDACERRMVTLTGSPNEMWLVVVPPTYTPPPSYPGGEFQYRISGGPLPGSCLALGPDSDYTFRCQQMLVNHHAVSLYNNTCFNDVDLGSLCGGSHTPGGDAMASVYLEAGQVISVLWFPEVIAAVDDRPTDYSGCLALISDFRGDSKACIDAFCAHYPWTTGTLTAQASGWHWLVVDSPSTLMSNYQWGQLRFDYVAPPRPPAHDACEGAVAISPGAFEIYDDLADATNQVDPGRNGCMGDLSVSYTGRDLVYRVSIPENYTLDATLVPDGGWDAALYLINDCAEPVGACVAVGQFENGGVRLRYTAQTHEDLWLICDSFGLGERPFTLIGTLDVTTDVAPDAPPRLDVYAAPNPFNPWTRVSYSLPRGGRARLQLYSLDGKLLRTLIDRDQAAGRYDVMWDGRDESGRVAASGAYVVQLEAGGRRANARVLLLK
jgi:hypothetical protein